MSISTSNALEYRGQLLINKNTTDKTGITELWTVMKLVSSGRYTISTAHALAKLWIAHTSMNVKYASHIMNELQKIKELLYVSSVS